MANKILTKRQKQMRVINDLIMDSPRFKKEYGIKLIAIKAFMPYLNDGLIEKIHGFLLLEKEEKR